MALLTDQEVQLRISARAEGQAGVASLTASVDDLQNEMQAVAETAQKSAAAQAAASDKLQLAKTRLDDVKLSLMSAKNEYRYLAERAKESGAAQTLFAEQAAYAKNKVAALNTDLVVARGNVKFASDEHRRAAREVRTHAAEQQRLGEQLRTVEAESRRASLATEGLTTAAKTAAKSIAGIEMGRQFIEANVGLESLERALTQILGGSDKARAEIEWLRQTTNRLGIDTLSAAKAYTSLAASAKGTTLEGEGARRIFEAVAGSMSKLGKSSADTEGALQAVSQMMGKGVVSMEEMRQQLAERLPGAMQATASELGITVGELTEMISTGNVLAEDMLPKLAAGLEKMYGTSGQAEGTISAWNRLKNSIAETFQFIGQTGVMTALATILGATAKIVAGLTTGFDLLGRTIGNTAGLLADVWTNPKAALARYREEQVRAHEETVGALRKTLAAADSAATGQTKLAEQGNKSAAAARESNASWLTVVQAYGKVATAATTATEQAVKSSAARQEEGKASLALATQLGSESEKRTVAVAVATRDAEALTTLANARQHEAAVARAQAEALAAVAKSEGAVSEQKRKAMQEATEKANALQSEAEKSAAAALGARQHAAAIQTETAALADNSARTAELKSNSEQAAAALQLVKAARDAGTASAQQVADAEIKAAQAANLYRDSLKDQTSAIEHNARIKKTETDLKSAGIRLEIEQINTMAQVAKAYGDESTAAAMLIRAKQLEIELAELTANAKRAEARASLAIISAKRTELEASGALTVEKRRELEAQELSAQVKLKEAEIAGETADRLRQLINATADGADAANAAAGSYDRLSGSLDGVAAAANRAADAQSGLSSSGVRDVTTSPSGQIAPRQVDFTETFYRRGASIEEQKLAQKYVGELFARNQATMMTGNLGNEDNANRLQRMAVNDAVDKALAAARAEMATGQAVDLGTSVNDIIARNMGKTQLRSMEDMIARIKYAGNEAKQPAPQKTIRLEFASGGKRSSVFADDEDSANAFLKTLEAAGMRAAP